MRTTPDQRQVAGDVARLIPLNSEVNHMAEHGGSRQAYSGHSGIPYGDRQAGIPHEVIEHDGHDVANLTTQRGEDGAIGRRVCLDCDVILGPLVLCGERTKKSRPCRVTVRIDLGHTVCWSHGEGAGRTSTPRCRKGAA